MRNGTSTARKPVLCFGEILWDFLPSGRFAGGAPFNVAYHLRQLGIEARLISAVGKDLLGDDLVRHVEARGVDSHGIARHPTLPTGTVRAVIARDGSASYDIAAPVAWDGIPLGDDERAAAAMAAGLVFGSLAQRSMSNRTRLDELLALLPPTAERVFDVNLRPPFDDLAFVRRYAGRATLLKLNHDEAARVAGTVAAGIAGIEADARALAERYGCPSVCVTAAEHGAGILRGGRWTWCEGHPVSVVDTVGAGDAFLASLIRSRLGGESDAVALRGACRLGEWVASRQGATPEHEGVPAIR